MEILTLKSKRREYLVEDSHYSVREFSGQDSNLYSRYKVLSIYFNSKVDT